MIIASNSHQHTTTNVEKCQSLNCRGIAVDLLVSAGRLVPHWLGSSTFVLKSATCSCVWLVCNPLPSSNVAVQVIPRVSCMFVSSQGWASLPSQMLSTSLLAWRAIADKDCAIRIDWLCWSKLWCKQTSGEAHQIQMLTPTLDFSGVTRTHKLLSTLPVNCNLAEMRYIWCTRYINSLVLLGSPFDDLNLHHALDLDWTLEVRTTQSVTCWLCHKMKIPFCTQSCVISEFCKKNMYDTFDLNVGYLWNDSKSKGYASKNTLHSSGAPFLGTGEDQFLGSVLDFTLLLRKGETCLASSKSCILLTMMRWCRVAPKSSDSSTWERSAAAFSIFLGGVFAPLEIGVGWILRQQCIRAT